MTTTRRMQTEGITVNVRVEGTGKPLLFLGGSNFDLSLRATVFDSDLPRHFEVAAADPRGLGVTDAPDGDWTMQDYARDALHLIDALGWDRVDVLGESFGAMTALHLAALAPQRINRMALCVGAAGGVGGQSYPIHELKQIADVRLRAKRALGIVDTRFEALLVEDRDAAEVKIEARVASDATFMAHSKNAEGHPRLLQARAAHDAWSELPTIATPTLVFAGQFDQQAPLERAENIAAAMPNATLHVVEGGHNICFVSPIPVAKIIENWT